jgi:glycine/D-amino acid oxidase-like deaminating enzyme
VFEEDSGFAAAVRDRTFAESFGVPVEVVGAAELGRREPALHPGLAGALFYPAVAHVIDPLRVSQALARAFVSGGGRIVRGFVQQLRSLPDAVAVATEAGVLRADHAVVAAGIGSRALCRTLGFDPPLVAEMGYHVVFPGAQRLLSAPVASARGGFIVTPMADHLRVAGTVEFARREAPPDWRRADVLVQRAGRLFREPLRAGPDALASNHLNEQRWHGCRPTLPDFLPAIGPLPGHPRVLAAFGHQHIGLTTAAVTGVIVRDLVLGARPAFELAAYAPGRFRG